MHDFNWSPSEKKVARAAFDLASERDCNAIRLEVESMLKQSKDGRVVWQIDDYLSQRRREHDQTFDYRYSVLIRVFARLIQEGYLTEDDLDGLADDKLNAIRRISSIA